MQPICTGGQPLCRKEENHKEVDRLTNLYYKKVRRVVAMIEAFDGMLQFEQRKQENLAQWNKSRSWYTCQHLEPLSKIDRRKRLKFAERMMAIMKKDPIVLDLILFTGEKKFPLSSNARGWRKFLGKGKTDEHKRKPCVTVWYGMTSGYVFGPYIFRSIVTEKSYLRMIRSYLLDDVELNTRIPSFMCWFQQDSSRAHLGPRVMSFLKDHFQGRLISNGCQFPWPPRSEDLSPIHYFLWPYINETLAPIPPVSTTHLRTMLTRWDDPVHPDLLREIVYEFRTRLELCIKAKGGRFDIQKA